MDYDSWKTMTPEEDAHICECDFEVYVNIVTEKENVNKYWSEYKLYNMKDVDGNEPLLSSFVVQIPCTGMWDYRNKMWHSDRNEDVEAAINAIDQDVIEWEVM